MIPRKSYYLIFTFLDIHTHPCHYVDFTICSTYVISDSKLVTSVTFILSFYFISFPFDIVQSYYYYEFECIRGCFIEILLYTNCCYICTFNAVLNRIFDDFLDGSFSSFLQVMTYVQSSERNLVFPKIVQEGAVSVPCSQIGSTYCTVQQGQ